jgi:hypothetical protein
MLARKTRCWPGRRDAGQEDEMLARKTRCWQEDEMLAGRRDAGQEDEMLARKTRYWRGKLFSRQQAAFSGEQTRY